ncbi:unnamed protein product, partial [Urochloa humidicola]
VFLFLLCSAIPDSSAAAAAIPPRRPPLRPRSSLVLLSSRRIPLPLLAGAAPSTAWRPSSPAAGRISRSCAAAATALPSRVAEGAEVGDERLAEDQLRKVTGGHRRQPGDGSGDRRGVVIPAAGRAGLVVSSAAAIMVAAGALVAAFFLQLAVIPRPRHCGQRRALRAGRDAARLPMRRAPVLFLLHGCRMQLP